MEWIPKTIVTSNVGPALHIASDIPVGNSVRFQNAEF